jgi:hypothetical protein
VGGGGRGGERDIDIICGMQKEKTFQAFDLVFICKKETTFQTMTRIGDLFANPGGKF